MAGVSTVQEDKQVLEEISNNQYFSDLLDVMNNIDAIDGMDDLRNEFNDSIDEYNDFNEIDRHYTEIDTFEDVLYLLAKLKKKYTEEGK